MKLEKVGRLELISPIRAGEPLVVAWWKMAETGRMGIAGGAIFSTSGQLLAMARHTLAPSYPGVPMESDRWQ